MGGFDATEGKAGDDQLDGGDGVDTVVYQFDPAGVTVDLAAGTATDGYSDNDTLISIKNIIGSEFGDRIEGNEQINSLTGRKGDDFLEGHGDDDFILGGDGKDILNGGKGRDSFIYLNSGEGGDRIEDFEPGVDAIRPLVDSFASQLTPGEKIQANCILIAMVMVRLLAS